MLQQLLIEIRTGGTLEVNSLAVRMGTSPQMVHAMLEHLRRSGMITNYDSCGDTCGGCALSNDCSKLDENSIDKNKIRLYSFVGGGIK